MRARRNTRSWTLGLAAASVAALLAVTTGVASAGKPGPRSTGPEGLYGSDVASSTFTDFVWSFGHTGDGIDVAVIDTGVNAVQGLDGTGKIIDGPDFSFDSDDANLRHRDLYGHGTAMASLVAGAIPSDTKPNQINDKAVGMAPDARIVNVKVGDGVGAVDVSQVIAAIDWTVQHRNDNGMNIKVLLLAFDTNSTQDYLVDPLAFAVENAWHHGITVVVSAGNDGKGAQQLGNPAIDPYVIAVAALEPGQGANWKVPNWASSGDGIRNPDVAMPGSDILTASVPGSFLANAHPDAVFDTPDGQVIRGNGTSQAAALAAGVAATLLDAHPSWTPDQVKSALANEAWDVGVPEKFAGNGLIDTSSALYAMVGFATQTHPVATGLGSLEGARGSYHVGPEGDQLSGETTAFGDTWNPTAWTTATSSAAAFTDSEFAGASWSGGSWLGASWSGASWSGASWSGASWSGASWSGASWSGASWSGASWSGASWSGASWSGASWSGASWSGASWSGATWA